MDTITRKALIGLVLLLGYSVFAANGPDPRKATVRDTADAESQVSGLTLTNVDLRFGFAPADEHGRLVVATDTVEYSIPLAAISHIVRDGNSTWEVTYQTAAGEATVKGALTPEAVLTGNSDFGTFSLPLARLNRLDFQQRGAPGKPAGRVGVTGPDGRPRPESFSAALMLTDGTRIEATQLRRNQVSAQSVTDPALLNVAPSYALVCNHYTDFRLLRGETLQTIPFENVKSAEFLPGGDVNVRAVSGLEASMKIPHEVQETLDGFSGSSVKGDFYVQFKFVRMVTFSAGEK